MLEQQLALVDLGFDGGGLNEIMIVVPLRRSMDRWQR